MMETTIAYIQQNLYTVMSLGGLVVLLFAVTIYKLSHKPTTTFVEHIQEGNALDDVSDDKVKDNVPIKSDTKKDTVNVQEKTIVKSDTKDAINSDVFDKIAEATDSKGQVDKELGDDVVIKSYVEKTVVKDFPKDTIRETVVKSVPLTKSLDDKIHEDDMRDSVTNNHSTVSISVINIGANRLEVIKIIYEVTGFALKDAHEIAESKGAIPFKVSLKQADRILKNLKDAGAIAVIK